MRYAIERQRLEAARRELERQRDEFFASVSHDLRTPVAAIKAAIGVVLANEPADMPPTLHRLLGNIDLAADELGAADRGSAGDRAAAGWPSRAVAHPGRPARC